MTLKDYLVKYKNEYNNFISLGGTSVEFIESFSKRSLLLLQNIIFHFAKNPGELVYVADEKEKDELDYVFGEIWENVHEELFEVLFFGEYKKSGFTDEFSDLTIYSYAERLKKLRPTFSSTDFTGTEFEIYYCEALLAWLYGLNVASFIICWSFLENLLKQKVMEYDIAFYIENRFNDRWLNIFLNKLQGSGLLNEEDKKNIHLIKKRRNQLVHEIEIIDDQEAYNGILKTKILVEKILRTKEGSKC